MAVKRNINTRATGTAWASKDGQVTRTPTDEPIIRVVRGDITEIACDAIVNAANSSLQGGGGVDGAIHAAGGPEILEACLALRQSTLPGGLPTGQAVATTAGRLPARWVIHTVGPIHGRPGQTRELLASCYRESLRVADEVGAVTVAFPTISAGVYGWPLDDATRVAVETVRNTQTQVVEVILVAFNSAAEQAYLAALAD